MVFVSFWLSLSYQKESLVLLPFLRAGTAIAMLSRRDSYLFASRLLCFRASISIFSCDLFGLHAVSRLCFSAVFTCFSISGPYFFMRQHVLPFLFYAFFRSRFLRIILTRYISPTVFIVPSGHRRVMGNAARYALFPTFGPRPISRRWVYILHLSRWWSSRRGLSPVCDAAWW